jgi:hypothetical protein
MQQRALPAGSLCTSARASGYPRGRRLPGWRNFLHLLQQVVKLTIPKGLRHLLWTHTAQHVEIELVRVSVAGHSAHQSCHHQQTCQNQEGLQRH